MSDSVASGDAGDSENVNAVAAANQPLSLSPRADGEERASRSIVTNINPLKSVSVDIAACMTENDKAETKEHKYVQGCHCFNESINQQLLEYKTEKNEQKTSSGFKTKPENVIPSTISRDECGQDSREMDSSSGATFNDLDISQSLSQLKERVSPSFLSEYHIERNEQKDIVTDNLEQQTDHQSQDYSCEVSTPFDEYFIQYERSGDTVETEGEKGLPSASHDLVVHPYVGGLTLDQLHDDVLFLIASYLEARAVKYGLSQVCQRFKAMFDNEAYWKMRITVRWPKKFPAVEIPQHFNWVDACVEREDSYRIWSNPAENTNHFLYSCNVFGEVDAVHLMNDGKLAVSGDRNRILNFIDLSKYPGPEGDSSQLKEMLIHSNRTAHQGWIWSIASVGDQVITGSWDTSVRIFDLAAGCSQSAVHKLRSAVLALHAEQNEIVAGCFDRKVCFIDPRSPAIASKTFHTKPVLCVTANEKFIITGSEDKSISVYDRRASKIFMMFKDLESYPMCLSYNDNQLWYGDKAGTLHLHDGTEGVFQLIGSYNIGHTEKMTGVINSRGALFTCSGDKTIKVLHPTRDPDTITTLAIHNKEIANIDYNNGVLVSAGGDDCIGVWLPKQWERDTYLL